MKISLARVILASSLVLSVSAGAMAQETEPLTLEPPMEPQALEPIVVPTVDRQAPSSSTLTTVPNSSGGWVTTAEPSAVISGSVGSIEVNELSTVTSDTAGLLREQDGGFPFMMWRGSNRATIDALFDRMPVATRSPAMRALMRRLLVSQSEPPVSLAGMSGPEGSFIARRLELLAAMGDSTTVAQLLDVTPGRATNERLLRIESDARLLRGDVVNACALMDEFVKDSMAVYWQKLFIFCQVLKGSQFEAELGISLMREIGVSDDLLFLMYDSMIRGEVPVIENLPDPTPLHIAVLGESKARLGEDMLIDPVPMVLPAIAANKNVDMEIRLQAAEQAVAANVMDVSVLRELYLAVEFDAAAINSPLSTAETSPGPTARALLYQVGMHQSVDGARAEATAMALERAKADSLYAPVSQAFMPVIAFVPPRSDLIWFAGDAVRAFALVGDRPSAVAWLGLLRANASLSSEAANALVRLVPIVRLAGLEETEQAVFARYDTLENWMKVDRIAFADRKRAVLLFTLLENLGSPVDAALWEALGMAETPESGVLPDPVIWQRLDAAGQRGKIGETATLALIMLGDGGPATAGPLVMGHVARILALNGFEEEARALSVEAALSAGL